MKRVKEINEKYGNLTLLIEQALMARSAIDLLIARYSATLEGIDKEFKRTFTESVDVKSFIDKINASDIDYIDAIRDGVSVDIITDISEEYAFERKGLAGSEMILNYMPNRQKDDLEMSDIKDFYDYYFSNYFNRVVEAEAAIKKIFYRHPL